MNASAVSDAQRNAEINGIKNCRFVAVKAEDVMGSLLKEYTNLSDTQQETGNLIKDDKEIEGSELSSDGSDALEPGNLEPDVQPVPASLGNDGTESRNQSNSVSSSDIGITPFAKFKNIVAIVDPPRVGLHPTVIKVLRTHSILRRLVYISCNPESLVANSIELCTPSADRSKE